MPSYSRRPMNPFTSIERYPFILAAVMLLILPNASTGFIILRATHPELYKSIVVLTPRPAPRLPQNQMAKNFNNDDEEESTANNYDSYDDDDDDDEDDYLEPVFSVDVRGRPAGVVIEDLSWRVEKLRLEEANTRRLLKARPRFLPYSETKKWVQAWGERWTSAEEWNEWIAAGEKRNSYIPSRPDEYYTRTGDWISWEDFLGVKPKDDDIDNSD